MTPSIDDWFIIINPHAGSGKTMSQWTLAQKVLDYLRISYTTVLTNHMYHAVELAYNAASKGYRKILAVGGDGSAHEAYNGVLSYCEETDTDPALFYVGVVPIGSGNDWIKSLDLPNDTEKMIEILAQGYCGKEDVVKMTFGNDPKPHFILNVAGLGFDSHVCQRVNFQKSNGIRHKMIYANALQHTIRNLSPINIEIIADDRKVFSGSCFSVAFGVGKYSGGGMRQTSDALMDDGLVDMMIVPKCNLKKIIMEMPRLLKGTIRESGHIVYVQARHIQILPLDSQSADIVEIDGELEGKLPLDITVTGRQINVPARKKS